MTKMIEKPIRPIEELFDKDEINWLHSLLDYLQKTEEEEWCVGVCRKADTAIQQNCLLGHVFNFGSIDFFGKNGEEGANAALNFFDNIATTDIFYPINDGTDTNYQESTPKQRCVSFLKNILSSKEKTVYQMWEEYGDTINTLKNAE